ncbi:MAG TPA: hypothetical protein VGI19_13960 [Candidatus Cybelea sp.]|jgi:hypothetical protein
MTTTIEKPTAPTAEYVSKLVADNINEFVDVVAPGYNDESIPGEAVVCLVEPETAELVRLTAELARVTAGSEDPDCSDALVETSFLHGYVADFMVKATYAAMTEPPAGALAQTRGLIEKLRAKLRRMHADVRDKIQFEERRLKRPAA